jgi:hypothetical protein
MIPFVLALAFLCIAIFVSVRGLKIRLLLIALSIFVLASVASRMMQAEALPIESAEIAVSNPDAVVRLEFWGVANWRTELGRRYIALNDAAGEIRKDLPNADWMHWPRASVYKTGDGRVALLTAGFDDYVIDPKKRTIETLRQGTPSDTWTYLGAFDFGEKYKGLKFFSASAQRECTATQGMSVLAMTRPQGRAFDCHTESSLR